MLSWSTHNPNVPSKRRITTQHQPQMWALTSSVRRRVGVDILLPYLVIYSSRRVKSNPQDASGYSKSNTTICVCRCLGAIQAHSHITRSKDEAEPRAWSGGSAFSDFGHHSRGVRSFVKGQDDTFWRSIHLRGLYAAACGARDGPTPALIHPGLKEQAVRTCLDPTHGSSETRCLVH